MPLKIDEEFKDIRREIKEEDKILRLLTEKISEKVNERIDRVKDEVNGRIDRVKKDNHNIIKKIEKNSKAMDSKLWIDVKGNNGKHTGNISKIYTIIGFTDDGITRWNGLITRIESLEGLKDDIKTLQIKQYFIYGIGGLVGVPLLGIFIAIIKKII